ncbi:MAG: nickel pincer cofactor biosynthesis protein LarB [Methanospirillaceae archaeon]|nr:nickel pincer cofactor biosynthesis protein LarB [Methanospirillaceae archaeon]
MADEEYLQHLLVRVQNGEIDPDQALAEIKSLEIERVSSIAHLDIGRETRCGIPEVVLAHGKDDAHLISIVTSYVQKSKRCIITRVSEKNAIEIKDLSEKNGYQCRWNTDAGTMVVEDGSRPVERNRGIIGIITAGTSDIGVAEEARVIAEEMGCTVKSAFDVGAAGIHRLVPVLKDMQDCHIFIVAAGREGTLPAVVAGIVNRPVIGVPVSTGYGYMGQGRAALASMLQSCSVLVVVNIDAGFVAGAFAARVAKLMAGGK